MRPNQLPGALKGTCCKDNSGQLGRQLVSIRGYILLGWKNALGALATQTKYIVIGGQNKKYNNEYSNSVVSFLWTRFYNNAAKIFGTEAVLCRRFVNLVFMTAYKESGSS